MSEYGTLVESGMVRFERLLPGPIERVWEYLTDSKRRALWFAGGLMELHVGGQVDLVFDHSSLTPNGEVTPERYKEDEGYRLRGRVTRCEPPRILGFTWDESEVIITLEPRGPEVRLTLTHRNLADRRETVNVSSGWHVHLDLLGLRLLGSAPQRYWSMVEQYDREYDERIPLSERR
jgi:uncharacterized protein YndB with AHSA1/START domain